MSHQAIKIEDICSCIEEFAPLAFQENWDNCGLIVGDAQHLVNKCLITIDVTEAVVAEAIDEHAQLIISHHPLMLSGVKKLTGDNDEQRAIALAIKNDIAIYAAHTNMDVTQHGVSHRMASKLGLVDLQVLSPQGANLQKLVTFVPASHYERLAKSIFDAGAGHIGNYDLCGYSVEGQGSFRALNGATPFVGEQEKLHIETEIRFETVFPSQLNKKIIDALISAHPYEEPAFDIYSLQNTQMQTGLGMIGRLPEPEKEEAFLNRLKEIFSAPVIRHTAFRGKEIQRVALCGGSGSSLLINAIHGNADVYVTADLKYHQFAQAEKDILIADIGHFESEQFTKEIFCEIIKKNFPTFAVYFSKQKTNPINYF